MKEEDFTKLARWVIPGWIAMFSYYLFVAIDTAACIAPKCVYPSLHALLSDGAISNQPVVAVIVLASLGVPVGFLIYQAYHFFRWNSPMSRSGFTALTSGRLDDLKRTLGDIKPGCLSMEREWKEHIVNHPMFDPDSKGDHSFKWRFVHFIFIEAVRCLDRKYGGGVLFGRYRYLQEIKHILGASIGAVYVGFLGYLFVKYHRGNMGEPTTYLLFTTASVFSLLFLIEKERKLRREFSKIEAEREQDSKTASSFAKKCPLLAIGCGHRVVFPYPSAFLVITFLFINFLANPYLVKSTSNTSFRFDVIIRLLFLFILTIAWISIVTGQYPVEKEKQVHVERISEIWHVSEVGVGGIIEGALSLGLAGVARWASLNLGLMSSFDWPYFLSLSVFMLISLLLFRNHYNTEDDLMTHEYYILREYLDPYCLKLKQKKEENLYEC